MSAPRYVECKCGHPRTAHPSEEEEACMAPDCDCVEYIPRTLSRLEQRPVVVQAAPVTEERSEEEQPVGSLDKLLASAKRSKSKRIVALAEKIIGLATDLRERIADEEASSAARAEVERLERALAEAKAKMRGGVSRTVQRATQGDGTCPDCGKDGLSNVGVHRAKAHGYRRTA